MTRRTHPGRHAAIVALAALTLGAAPILATACGGTSSASTGHGSRDAAPAAHAVKVDLGEFKVTPSTAKGIAGRVAFQVKNTGNVPHELVVIRTNKPASDLAKGARADESGNQGETGDLKPGESKSISLKLKPGHYALICNIPGHYRSGMHTDFTVGS